MNKKIWTQQDVDNWPVNEKGLKEFPAFAKFGKSCSFGERCSFGKSCSFGERCSFGESCSFGEWCSFGKSCSAESPFWGSLILPTLKITGVIYPPATHRGHWTQRLAEFVELPASGCYDTIFEIVKSRLDEILSSEKWLPVERLMLESVSRHNARGGEQ